jgi:predicted  nucleic acid-binding Zn-ribbon protein
MSALSESTSTESIDLTTDADTADLVEAIEQLAAENRQLRERQQEQAEEIAALESELEAVETELADVKSERDETKTELTDVKTELRATNDGLEAAQRDIALMRSQLTATREELDEAKWDLLNTKNRMAQLRCDHVKTKMRLQEVRDGEIDIYSAESSGADQDAGDSLEDVIETPLERIVAFSEEAAAEELHPNHRRARLIARDVREYAVKATAGYVVASSDIRTVLSALDENSHPETISRVIEFLDDLGGEDIEVVKRRGERRVSFSEDLVKRLATVEDASLTPCVSGNSVGA